MIVHSVKGRTNGPAFVDPISNSQTTTSEMNDLFLELMVDLFDSHRPLFGVDIKSSSDVTDKYHVFAPSGGALNPKQFPNESRKLTDTWSIV